MKQQVDTVTVATSRIAAAANPLLHNPDTS